TSEEERGEVVARRTSDEPARRTSEEIDKEFEEMFATMSVAPSPSLTKQTYSLKRRLSVNSWKLENPDANKAGVLPSSPVMRGLHGPVDVDWMPYTLTESLADAQEKNGWAASRTTTLPTQSSSSSSGSGDVVAAALASPRRPALE
ncbi:unnamed protein product, partial [Polarella glacialis]